MKSPYKILAIIPARKGSKGIPSKNTKLIYNKPLISWTIEAAQKSKYINKIIISTDCHKVKEISESYNINIPRLRPDNLSTDSASSDDVIKYELNGAGNFDIICMLQPTSPLRNEKHINDSLKLYEENNVNSLVSVVSVDAYHPLRMKKIENNKLVNYIDQGFEDMRPRQSLPKVYIRNGAIYLCKRDLILHENKIVDNSCIPYEMNQSESVNIDSEIDLIIADHFIKKSF